MVDAAQANRPHRVDGREVEPKRAVPRQVNASDILRFTWRFFPHDSEKMCIIINMC
jgi:hypothetical protein